MDNKTKICSACGQPIVEYKFSITIRSVYFLCALGYLSKRTGNKYHHFDDINEMVRKIWDKQLYKLSGYGRLAVAPFNLIIPNTHNQNKTNRSGYFKLSSRAIRFINGKEKIPERVLFRHSGYEIIDDKYITINDVRKLNFQETIKHLKTYS